MKKHLLACVIILLSIAATSPAIAAPAQVCFDKQAHRGGRAVMPENTVAAMKHALDLGMTLEMDLSYTKDGQVIVSHDNFISSVFALGPNGEPIAKEEEKSLRLYNLTYEEIKKYDVGMKPHPLFPEQKNMPASIPLFVDMLDSIEMYAKAKNLPAPHYNIEAKLAVPVNTNTDNFREDFIQKIVQVIKAKKIDKRMMLQSFDVKMLEILHRNYPEIKVSYLVGKSDLETSLAKLSFTPDIYSPHYLLVNKEMVEKCHSLNMKVIPWTVNTKAEVDQLKSLGVDGVISDYLNVY